MPIDNFIEQEFEIFKRDEVGKEEPLGDDNNGEEAEYKFLSYEDFNYNLVATDFLLGLSENKTSSGGHNKLFEIALVDLL